jgi:hypothetical protein
MSKPMIRIHDTSTDEVIDREMNDAEFAQYEAQQAAIAAAAQAAAERATARTALLAKLGITEEEAQLLLGGN